jgi:hypothetical protein
MFRLYLPLELKKTHVLLCTFLGTLPQPPPLSSEARARSRVRFWRKLSGGVARVEDRAGTLKLSLCCLGKDFANHALNGDSIWAQSGPVTEQGFFPSLLKWFMQGL